MKFVRCSGRVVTPQNQVLLWVPKDTGMIWPNSFLGQKEEGMHRGLSGWWQASSSQPKQF